MAELVGAPPTTSPAVAPPEVPVPAAVGALIHTASLTAAAVGALVLGALLGGRIGLAAVAFPLQALLVLAWLAALGTQGLAGAALIAVGAAGAADALLASGPPGVRRLVGVIAVGFLVAMLQQLARGGERTRLTTSLAATVGAVALVSGFAVFVALWRGAGGHAAVMTALLGSGVALVVSRGVDALRLRNAGPGAGRRSWLGVLSAGVAVTGIGLVMAAARDVLGAGDAIAIASAAAAVALAADIGLDLARLGLPPAAEADRTRAALLPLAVVLPIAVAAPAAYVAGRVLLG